MRVFIAGPSFARHPINSTLLFILPAMKLHEISTKPQNHDSHGFINSIPTLIEWLVTNAGVSERSISPMIKSGVLYANVDGNVVIKGMSYIPVRFNRVTDFTQINNSGPPIDDLNGYPQKISGNFRIQSIKLKSLVGGPVEVAKKYDCQDNLLTSLEGAPDLIGTQHMIGGVFDCSGNKLASLKGGPRHVYGEYYCMNNELTSLNGAPARAKIFDCSDNTQLVSLEGAPFECQEFYFGHTNIKSLVGIASHFELLEVIGFSTHEIEEGGLELLQIKGLTAIKQGGPGSLSAPFKIIEKYLGRPEDIFECQQELIEAGFEEYTKL